MTRVVIPGSSLSESEFEEQERSYEECIERLQGLVPNDVVLALVKEQLEFDRVDLADVVLFPVLSKEEVDEGRESGVPEEVIDEIEKVAGKRFSELPFLSDEEELEILLAKEVFDLAYAIAEGWLSLLYFAHGEGYDHGVPAHEKDPLWLDEEMFPVKPVPEWSREQGFLTWWSHIAYRTNEHVDEQRAKRLFLQFVEFVIAEIEKNKGELQCAGDGHSSFFVRKGKEGYYFAAEKVLGVDKKGSA